MALYIRTYLLLIPPISVLFHCTALLPTHTVGQLRSVRRKRREIEDSSVSLNLKVFNNTHSFRVSHTNGILSPDYILEEVGPDGVPRPIPSSTVDCYFVQEVRDEELAIVTICKDEIVSY